MSTNWIEALEGRTLLSALTVLADAAALGADALAVRTEALNAAATYKTDAAAIKADIKALPKTAGNSRGLARLNAAIASAGAIDKAAATHAVGVSITDLRRASAAYLAFAAKPTTANAKRLSKAITILEGAPLTAESKLITDIKVTTAKVRTALSTLAAGNPTDTTLQADITTAGNAQESILTTITTDVDTVNTALKQLGIDAGTT